MRRALATLADVVALPSDEAVFGPDPAAALLPTLRAVVRVATDGASSASWCGPAWDVLGTIAEAHAGLLDAPRKDLAAFFPAAAGRGAVSVAELLLPPLCDAARSDERGDEDASDTVDDAEASGPGAHARAALRRCAAALPPAATLPAALAPVAAAADAPVPRRSVAGALAAFAVVVEACACELESDAGALEAALRAIARSFQSGDPATARRGALALAELAEHAGAALAASEATAARVLELAADRDGHRHGGGGGGRVGAGGREGPRGVLRGGRLAVSKIAENFAGDELAPGLERLTRALVRGAAAGRAAAARARVSTSSPPSFARRRGVRAVRGGDAERARADGVRGFLRERVRGRRRRGAVSRRRRDGDRRRRRRVRSAPAGTTEALLDAACAGLAAGEAGRRRRDDSRDDRRVDRARVFAAMLRAARVDARVEARALDRARGPRRARRGSRGGGRAGKPRGGRRGRAAVTTGDAAVSVAAAEALGAMCNSCGAAARPLAAVALDALVEVATSPFASFAARLAATRAAECRAPVGRTGGGGGVGGGGAGARLARILDAAPRAAEAATRLADVLAREETPEVALAAAVSLETAAGGVAASRTRSAPRRGGGRRAGRRREKTRARGRGSRGARVSGRAGRRRRVSGGARGGGRRGHGGGDGEEHGMVFVDLEEMAPRVGGRAVTFWRGF